MRCPKCKSWRIQEIRVALSKNTPIYQCQACALVFGETPGGVLYKGKDVSHKFNPTARDGKG